MVDKNVTRKPAPILTIDMVAYSSRMSADETDTPARLKSYWQELIDSKIDEYCGRLVKLIGDGALIEFASIVNAVECATEIQRNLGTIEEVWADIGRIARALGAAHARRWAV